MTHPDSQHAADRPEPLRPRCARPTSPARRSARLAARAVRPLRQPQPPAWAAQPRRAALLVGYGELLRAQRAGRRRQRSRRRARSCAPRGASATSPRSAARIASALATPAPFVERLVHFWANHFAVSIDKPPLVLAGRRVRGRGDPAARPRPLRGLLLAVERHPAMLLYLDQARSIGPDSVAAPARREREPERQRGLNENLAREILELHTLGVRSGYTQADVTEFARALTGWSSAALPAVRRRAATASRQLRLPPALHEPGARSCSARATSRRRGAGRGHPARPGRAPATARHIAAKLARHFVADEPPPALVERLAEAFLRSGGDLPTVYRALVDAPEAWAAGRRPSSRRRGTGRLSACAAWARATCGGQQLAPMLDQLGQPVWRPGSPAGYDDVAASWAAPDALMRRVEVAQRLAAQAGDDASMRARSRPQLLPGALRRGHEHGASPAPKARPPRWRCCSPRPNS